MLRILSIVLSVFSVALAHFAYQALIPNGDKVPDPCNAGGIWAGVGHLNSSGGGMRNPFGDDFVAEGHLWSANLCGMDSDGDGRTNGEELGDSMCRYTPSNMAQLDAPTGHPGICEPVGDPACAGSTFMCS